MRRIKLLFIACIAAVSAYAQRASYNIIPLPKEVKADTTQFFTLKGGMGIAYDEGNAESTRIAQFLQEWVKQATAIDLQMKPADKNAPIRLSLIAPAKKSKKSKQPVELTEQQKESYTMTVGKDGILISAYEPAGLFRAAETLRKSLPIVKGQSVELPYVQITDQPRFS